MSDTHPSYLELDRWSLARHEGEGGSVSRHLAGCARCRAYVDGLVAPPMPARIAALDRPRRRTWLLWPAFAALPAAALVLLLLLPAPEETREKGPQAIAVKVHVKRQERVFLLGGDAAVRAGDRLRLSVAAAGYGHVAVATLLQSGEAALLYGGALPGDREVLLPPSWQVDAAPGPEVLYVVVGRRPLPRIDRRLLQGGGEPDVRVVRLVLQKDGS